jgi:hypothetical protein
MKTSKCVTFEFSVMTRAELRTCSTLLENLIQFEAQNLLGCTAVFLIECQPTFQRYVLPPSTGP